MRIGIFAHAVLLSQSHTTGDQTEVSEVHSYSESAARFSFDISHVHQRGETVPRVDKENAGDLSSSRCDLLSSFLDLSYSQHFFMTELMPFELQLGQRIDPLQIAHNRSASLSVPTDGPITAAIAVEKSQHIEPRGTESPENSLEDLQRDSNMQVAEPLAPAPTEKPKVQLTVYKPLATKKRDGN